MQFPITLLQSSRKLEINLVHLVTGLCGAGDDAQFSLQNFHFLVVGDRKEENEMMV